jgi:polyisoprenoid-binding protein YceI
MSTTKWVIDPTHSEIGFKVKHMMFTTISGKFSSDATMKQKKQDFKNAKMNLEQLIL